MTISAIQIGLDPDLIDFDSPDFAQFPGLTAERLRAAHEANLAGLRERGVDADGCLVDSGATAVRVVGERIAEKKYDAILIGAGIRLVAANSLLFESLVNLVHAELPNARFVFNTGPRPTPDDLLRWFPDAFD